MAGCTQFAIPAITPSPALLRPDADVTFTLPSGSFSFTVAATPENISTYAHTLLSSGYYRGQYIYRQVPGVCMATGIATLSGWRNARAMQLPMQQSKGGFKPIKTTTTGPGTVGLLRHANGTIGPELVIHYGINPLEKCPLPATRIGKITQGRDALRQTKKGDKILTTQLTF
ncbi:MAG: hypothetical protein EBQ80_02390 [Proteobacteria bacterium]|nr:hypothetical protein [Pseudomonadota bacterium]